jgi:hypothetical protein
VTRHAPAARHGAGARGPGRRTGQRHAKDATTSAAASQAIPGGLWVPRDDPGGDAREPGPAVHLTLETSGREPSGGRRHAQAAGCRRRPTHRKAATMLPAKARPGGQGVPGRPGRRPGPPWRPAEPRTGRGRPAYPRPRRRRLGRRWQHASELEAAGVYPMPGGDGLADARTLRPDPRRVGWSSPRAARPVHA